MASVRASANAIQRLGRFWNVSAWRIGPKMALTFFALALFPLLITGYVGITASGEAMLEQGHAALASTSRETAEQIDLYLSAHRADIVVISQLPQVIAFASNPNDAAARASAVKALTVAARKTDYESVAMVNVEGTTVLSSDEGDISTSIKTRPDFLEALKGTVFVSDPSVSEITNRPAIFFSAPIRNVTGNIVGVVRSRLALDGIWRLVEDDKNKAAAGTIGMLLDEYGIRLAHSASLGDRANVQQTLLFRAVAPVRPEVEKQLVAEKRWGKASETAVQVLPLPEVADALTNPDTKTFETEADNSTEHHHAVISSVTMKPWRYVVMTPHSTFTGHSDELIRYFVGITVAVAGLALLGGYFVARGFTNPIVRLTQVADRISLGELDTAIEVDRRDEIGELAEAVGRMQASLIAAIERLRARRNA